MRSGGWRKSTYSHGANGGDDCVEVADLSSGRVGVRDSKNPDGGHLTFSRTELAAWITAAKAGEFDDLG